MNIHNALIIHVIIKYIFQDRQVKYTGESHITWYIYSGHPKMKLHIAIIISYMLSQSS